MTARLRFGWLQVGLVTLGLVLIGLWSGDHFASRAFQSAESKKLDAALREAEVGPSEAAASPIAFAGLPASGPPRHATARRGALGRIEIPGLRIAAIVAEGADVKTLSHAVGHVPSSALPGDPGNVVLAGHRDSFFRGLGGVHKNTLIRFVTREATYTYRVEWTEVVAPQRVDVTDSTAVPSLTLITCFPFRWVGHAPKRFVVRARQVERHREVLESRGASATLYDIRSIVR